MPKSVERTGKTIDEAVQEALVELGVSIDDVVIDVLDEGDSGILGIGRKPARVLVSYDGPDLDVLPVATDETAVEAVDAEVPVEEAASESEVVYFGDDEAELAGHDGEEEANRAVNYLEDIFSYMDIDADFSFELEDDRILIDVDGEDVGAAIGRRGDTLNAMQYLTSLVVNRGSDKHRYVTVDIAGYRKRREKSLTEMAERTAKRVIEVGKDFVMEPMTAAERRIIHTALQDYPGIRTESEGVEPRRSVVIIPLNRN